MNDEWEGDSDLPDRLPPKEDRVWAHPSEFDGNSKTRNKKRLGIVGALGLVLVGLVFSKTFLPASQSTITSTPASSVSIGSATSTHISKLAHALVKISIPGNKNFLAYGVAVSPFGYLLVPSNALVKSNTYSVTFANKSSLNAKLVARDNTSDTALLKVPAMLTDYISGASLRTEKPGQMAIAIGPNTVTSKPALVISQIKKTGLFQTLPGGQTTSGSFLADAAKKLNPEGLLFVDDQGNPLGIGLYQTGAGWIISPLTSMLSSAQKIELRNGMPAGWLGIVGTSSSIPMTSTSIKDSASSTTSTTVIDRGVQVFSVAANSPAAQAGVKPNDVIIALNNIPIKSLIQLQSLLAGYPSGSQVTLTLLRNNSISKMTTQLGGKS